MGKPNMCKRVGSSLGLGPKADHMVYTFLLVVGIITNVGRGSHGSLARLPFFCEFWCVRAGLRYDCVRVLIRPHVVLVAYGLVAGTPGPYVPCVTRGCCGRPGLLAHSIGTLALPRDRGRDQPQDRQDLRAVFGGETLVRRGRQQIDTWSGHKPSTSP